jgi:hypothetical protein
LEHSQSPSHYLITGNELKRGCSLRATDLCDLGFVYGFGCLGTCGIKLAFKRLRGNSMSIEVRLPLNAGQIGLGFSCFKLYFKQLDAGVVGRVPR